MILQALKEYYDRKAEQPDSTIAPLGWEWKEIPFVIVLDQAGQLVQIEDTREGVGKKKRAKAFLVPKGEKKTSGISANLLWDTAGYIFGVDKQGDNSRALKQKQAFMDRLKQDIGDIPAVQPVIEFLDSITEERLGQEACWEEIKENIPVLTFRLQLQTALLCRHTDIVSRISRLQQGGEAALGTCLITGEQTQICSLHTSLKGVYGAQPSGANIVSFNLDAFTSYGKEQGFNAPVGVEAEFAYTTALNTLLSDSAQRIQVGDASTVFWSARQSDFETAFSFFFKEPEKDNPDEGTEKIRALFESVESGAYREDDGDTPFYILGLSPNAARISVRFWHADTIAKFAGRIRQHFEDFRIMKPPGEPEYYSLWRVLVNIAMQDKSDNIPPNLAGEVMRAILDGTPYPATVLQAALRRIRSDTERRVKPVRAALLKAYFNRYHRFYSNHSYKEVAMELDVSQPSVGYQLGRLFAVLEKIQEEANPGLNATIRERFYGAACTTPVTVFATLLRLKNHHLAKLDNKGRVVNLERLLGEIIGHILSFPPHLSLMEQGLFAIGYYHQRQALFTTNKGKDVEESENITL